MAVVRGLFVGLCTLDVIQAVARVPAENEKVVARRQTVAAGGPATNAAVTFAHLGGQATLVTGIGRHPLAAGIHADLAERGVRVRDLTPTRDAPPAVSSILVTEASGARAVASTNAAGARLVPPDDLEDLVGAADIVQVDGHHPEVAAAALRVARAAGRPTVLDGGSWKPGTDELLPLLDVAACSADFRAPGASTSVETAARLRAAGIPWVAVTGGAAPIRWRGPHGTRGEVPVPAVRVVDTLGAGDVFHGALTFRLAGGLGEMEPEEFAAMLAAAASVASRACAAFGTRTWLAHPNDHPR